MDLPGDQSVQVVLALLRAAIVLSAAMLTLLLVARLAKAANGPLVLAPQPFVGPCPCRDVHDQTGVLLARCLPVRAPPDLTRRNSLSPPGVRPPQ